MKLPINSQAPVTATASITINSPVEKVWQILTDIDNWHLWQKDIPTAKISPPLKSGSSFTWKTGGTLIRSTIHTSEPYFNFGWSGRAIGARAIHNWRLISGRNTTVVSVEESMEGFLVRIFARTFRKNLQSGMERWLQFLKEVCEK